MKNLLFSIITLTILSCGKNKKEENQLIDEVPKENTENIAVEPNNGIGDGALSIINLHIKKIEEAHKKSEFLNHNAVSFNTNIFFGGKQRLDAKITMLTNSTKIKIDKKDGSTLIYNGKKVFLSPKDANDKGARFDMFTWSYFFGLPYKLNDPGTKLELTDPKPLDGAEHQTTRLSFEKGTGDAPDDWYVIYTDPKDNIIKVAAYIVTFGNNGDTSKAEGDPHAIYYKDFKTTEGIPFATKWEFYEWTQEKGITNKIGEATITDITFLKSEDVSFKINEDAKEIKL